VKIAIPFVFADKELDQIARALPASASAHRLSLLPNVLREWAENYLPEYAVLADSRESAMDQTKRRAKVGSAAVTLQAAMAVLKPDDLSSIALEMGRTDESVPMRDRLEHFTEKLMEQSRSLSYLIAGVASLQKRMKSGPGQPRNIIAYLVLRDIAAIYGWVTGNKAHREVDRVRGTEIGAFYQFAAAIWPLVFSSADDGLPAAMKNWSLARRQFREAFPLLINIGMNYPPWRILDP
jgi:hypothetical protein